jgi:pyruvate dehydrogenase E1 component alpha subunit
VDGNDVFAVYRACLEALKKARSGGGPTFIECLTYRMADHTSADDASRYRSSEEVASWAARDPILRLRLYMASRGLWSEGYDSKARAAATASVDQAVQTMEAQPLPVAGDMFNHISATLSPRQAGQLRGL